MRQQHQPGSRSDIIDSRLQGVQGSDDRYWPRVHTSREPGLGAGMNVCFFGWIRTGLGVDYFGHSGWMFGLDVGY